MRARAGDKPLPPVLVSDWTWAAGVFVACLILYAPTLTTSVAKDDSAEFQMLSPLLGVSHPTGYPLFLLLSWVATRLPLGDLAFRVTLLSMLTAALVMATVFLLLRELEVRRSVAAISALLLASTPGLWLNAVSAEVYPLAVFFLALGSWLLVRWGKGKMPLWAVTLAFGFALTHHVSIRLVAPAVLVYLLLVQPRLILRPKQWLPALATLLLPLALYAYVPLRAAHFESLPLMQDEVMGIPKVVAAGNVSPSYALGGAVDYFLAGRQSGSVLSGLRISPAILLEYLKVSAQQYPLWAVLPLAAVGLVVMLKRQTREGVYFLLAYGVTAWAVLRYLGEQGRGVPQLLPLHVITIVWFAVGASWLIEWLDRRWHPAPFIRALPLLLLACLPLANIVHHYPEALAQQRTDYRSEALGILQQPLPEGAAIAGPWSEITTLRYLQRIEGIRPDLWIMHADETGIQTILWPAAVAEGRPFYVLRATEAGLRLLPLPPLTGVSPAHEADIGLGNVVRWRGYDLPEGPVSPGSVLPITLYWQPSAAIDRNWVTFIHLVDEQGNRVAQVDRVPLAGLDPPTQWKVGQLVADPYELPVPTGLAPGRYTLLMGWYDGEDRLTWEDGEDFHRLAEVEVQP